jgi:hypothetical protein
MIRGTGPMGKAAVTELLDRHGEPGFSAVKTKVVPNVRRKTLASEVWQHAEAGATVYAYALASYSDLG